MEGSQLQEKASGDLRTGNCLTGTSGVWDRPSFACEQAVSSRSSFCLLPQPWVLAAIGTVSVCSAWRRSAAARNSSHLCA